MSDHKHTSSAPENNEESTQEMEQENIGIDSNQLESQLEELQAKYNEMSDAFLRSRAEIENNRKRALDEETKTRKFAIEGFAKGLLAVKDSLEAALRAENQTVDTFREGVETTLRQLSAAFQDNQLQEILPEKGEKLDPHIHQAMAIVPAPEQQPNTIVEVLQKGYILHDRVLRPAMVIIASAQ